MYIEQVKNFHKAFKHPAPNEMITDCNNPQMVNLMKDRIRYMLEELDEMSQVFGFRINDVYGDMVENNKFKPIKESEKNITGAIDAAVDLEYFLAGTLVALGVDQLCFNECFTDVHLANMNKLVDINNLEATKKHYDSMGVQYVVKETNDITKFIIQTISDNKILKPFGYVPANLEPIVKKYTE